MFQDTYPLQRHCLLNSGNVSEITDQVSQHLWSHRMCVAQGLLSVASAVTGRDLYAEGRTLEALGLHGLSRSAMAELLAQGV